MKPRICVPLPVERLSDLAPMIGRAEDAGADLIEIRLDYLRGDFLSQMDDVKKVISQASVPLIATNRMRRDYDAANNPARRICRHSEKQIEHPFVTL